MSSGLFGHWDRCSWREFLLPFAAHSDSRAGGGLLMADVWLEERSVTIDLLGDDFLKAVETGDPIKVYADGTVEVG